MLNKVKVAVVGVGRMGGKHSKNILNGKVKGAVLSAVCDISLEALAKFRDKVNCYDDYHDLINAKIDAVIIATPHYLHGELAKYFIEHGIHVLIEKPLTVTSSEAKEVIDCAANHPEVKVAVMLNQRTNPLYGYARDLIKKQELGDIMRVNFIVTDWYRSQAYYNQGGWRASYVGEGGGTLINQCVHQLDVLQWICGMPDSVSAFCRTVNRNITTENEVTAVFEYLDGHHACFTASAHELRGTNRLEIAGTGGRIVIDKYKMTLYTFMKDEKTVNATTKQGYGWVARKKKTKRYGLRLVGDLIYGQQKNVIKNFIASIRINEPLISPLVDGLNSVELINATYLSHWKNEKVFIPLDDMEYLHYLEKKIADEKLIKE